MSIVMLQNCAVSVLAASISWWRISASCVLCFWSYHGQSVLCFWSYHGQSVLCFWSYHGQSVLHFWCYHGQSVLCFWSCRSQSVLCFWSNHDQKVLWFWSYHGQSVLFLKLPRSECVVFEATKVRVCCVFQGALVTVCSDDTLHLWNFRQKRPEIVHSLKFQRERCVLLIKYIPGNLEYEVMTKTVTRKCVVSKHCFLCTLPGLDVLTKTGNMLSHWSDCCRVGGELFGVQIVRNSLILLNSVILIIRIVWWPSLNYSHSMSDVLLTTGCWGTLLDQRHLFWSQLQVYALCWKHSWMLLMIRHLILSSVKSNISKAVVKLPEWQEHCSCMIYNYIHMYSCGKKASYSTVLRNTWLSSGFQVNLSEELWD